MSLEATTSMLTAADRDWFGEQVNELLPQLFGCAFRLCRDRTEAEDVVAESIAKAWEALPSLKDRTAFRGWVFRILNNRVISHCRSLRSRTEHERIDTVEPDFSLFERLHEPILLWWGNPELEFLNRLLREDIDRAIGALPEEFRVTIVLVDVQGLSYAEAADLLEVPIGTIRSRLSRGRSLLQAALWHHARDAGLIDRRASERQNQEDA